MAKTADEICKELDAKIPRDVVSLREGGGGKKLSYLEGHYVIDRLNKVFGHLSWASETMEMEQLPTENVSYRARVRITVRGPDGVVVSHDGYGYGSDKSKHTPHELAVKEAETDALKRAAMKFGMSMGLALYDKTQENVDDGEENKATVQKRTTKPTPAAGVEGIPAKSAAPVTLKAVENNIPESPPEDRKTLNDLLSAMSKVIVQKRIASVPEILGEMKKKFNTDRKEELTDDQAKAFYGELRGMIA